MTPITFKKNSWHAWLVKHFTPLYLDSCNDICQYIRYVFLGVFLFTIVSLFCAVLLRGFIFDIQWLLGYVHWTQKGSVSLGEACGCIFNGIAAALSALFGIGFITYVGDIVKDIVKDKIQEKEPGFVKLAYRSFKDKICYKVDFE